MVNFVGTTLYCKKIKLATQKELQGQVSFSNPKFLHRLIESVFIFLESKNFNFSFDGRRYTSTMFAAAFESVLAVFFVAQHLTTLQERTNK